ncbi:hypothetical protein ACIPJK_07515 [Streptomyces roseus]|uniref:hypothetical protein n=1 Tax=Streptomyces roseus TaxID=66430 RepID=UPI00380E6B6D
MTHRTQLSQPEEALRRADAAPANLRTLMERIAAWISFENSDAAITPADLDYFANHQAWAYLKRASRLGSVDNDRREALRAALIAAMPAPRGETRGEYALRLRAAARAS